MSQVLRATVADMAQVAELERQIFSDAMSRELLAQSLENDFFVVLKDEDRVLGYFLAQCVLDEMEILRIAVDPACRRKGYGRQILSTVKKMAFEQRIAWCYLEVRESNAAARCLYESSGFTSYGKRKGFYRQPDEDAVIMKAQWSVKEDEDIGN